MSDMKAFSSPHNQFCHHVGLSAYEGKIAMMLVCLYEGIFITPVGHFAFMSAVGREGKMTDNQFCLHIGHFA